MGSTRHSTRDFDKRKKIQTLIILIWVLALFPVYSVISKPHKNTSTQTDSLLSAPLSIEIDHQNLLTLRGDNIPTEEVLEAIAQTSDLDLYIQGSFNKNVSFRIEERPVLEVLLHVLKDQNFVSHHIHTLYDEQKQEQLRRGELWVYSFNPGRRFASNAIVRNSFDITNIPVGRFETNTWQPEMAEPDLSLIPDFDLALLSSALSDKNEFVRGEAVSTLADMYNEEAAAVLVTALDDQEPWIREEAIDALGDIGGKIALQALARMVHDADSQVRDAAFEAIIGIGGDDAAHALDFALHHHTTELRGLAVDALAEMEGELAIKLLQQASSDPDTSVREAATRYLEELLE